MAKPKLALIPAAQGDKFYSVLPSSGVGDFDFTRSGGATRINAQGLIETVASGVSRLNYPLIDGVVKGCPSHLLEPQSTNLFTYSEDFSNAAWTKSSSAVTITSNVAPDGTINSVYNLTGTNANLYTGGTPNIEHTISVYAKSNGQGKDNFKLRLGNSTSSSIIVTDKWVRYELTATPTTTVFGLTVDSSPNNEFDILIWGAQLEQGSFPTSYIKSNGSQTTRSAETASNSGDASTFNDSEGVLMAEMSALADDGTDRRITLSDGSGNNRIVIGFRPTSQQVIGWMIVNGVNTPLFYTSSDVTTNSKYALKYKQNDLQFWIDGFKVDYSLSVDIYPNGTLNELKFEDGDGGANLYGSTKQLQYFDSALTDSELETLTSWVSFTDMANGQLYTIE